MLVFSVDPPSIREGGFKNVVDIKVELYSSEIFFTGDIFFEKGIKMGIYAVFNLIFTASSLSISTFYVFFAQ